MWSQLRWSRVSQKKRNRLLKWLWINSKLWLNTHILNLGKIGWKFFLISLILRTILLIRSNVNSLRELYNYKSLIIKELIISLLVSNCIVTLTLRRALTLLRATIFNWTWERQRKMTIGGVYSNRKQLEKLTVID